MTHKSSKKPLTFTTAVEALKMKSVSWMVNMQQTVDVEMKLSNKQQKMILFSFFKSKFAMIYFME
jgi:hypothetical protein